MLLSMLLLALHCAAQVDLDRLLLCQGLDLPSLQDAATHPVTVEALERSQQVGRGKQQNLPWAEQQG